MVIASPRLSWSCLVPHCGPRLATGSKQGNWDLPCVASRTRSRRRRSPRRFTLPNDNFYQPSPNTISRSHTCLFNECTLPTTISTCPVIPIISYIPPARRVSASPHSPVAVTVIFLFSTQDCLYHAETKILPKLPMRLKVR